MDFGASWGAPGHLLGRLGGILGASWGRLGASLGRLGVCLGRSGGPFWLPVAPFVDHFGLILAAWGSHLDPPGGWVSEKTQFFWNFH